MVTFGFVVGLNQLDVILNVTVLCFLGLFDGASIATATMLAPHPDKEDRRMACS